MIMNKLLSYFSLVILLLSLGACTTKDVILSEQGDDSEFLYEITDAALGDYLIYNCEREDENRLPYGTAFLKDGKHYINTRIAATADLVYLVKNTTQIGVLKEAGVPTAEDKIVNMDGIQYFTNTTVMKLTSNSITSMDLTKLTKLTTLEMNANLMSSIDLSQNKELTSLRYSASGSATLAQKLSEIDLSANTKLVSILLTNHNIGVGGLTLPTTFASLTSIEVEGNPGAPFPIPAALYNQLTIKKGVENEETTGPEYTGPTPKEDYFQIPDLAFADYLVYLVANGDLSEGCALKHTDNLIYLNKAIAATATVLNVSKTSGSMTTLENAGVATAKVKIADADGLQFFTSLTKFTATSNEFMQPLKLTNLVDLVTLELNTAYVGTLDISGNKKLETLNCSGSSKAGSANKLSSIDLSKNEKLTAVNLENNLIATINVDNLTLLTSLKLLGNSGADFAIPAIIYNNLTTKSGVISQ